MACLNSILRVCWFLVLNITCSLISGSHSSSDEDRKVYIVYMGERPKGEFSAATLHSSMLQQVIGSGGSDYLLYSYHRSFNGFVAKLTPEEKEKMAEMEGVVSVFPSQKKKLHTSKSWDFMGFPQNVKRSTNESNIIIGMLDSGIWPKSQSFNDDKFGPPPSKWKGSCMPGTSNFTCNNKIVGARFYKSDGRIPSGEVASPIDTDGHGTHTTSIAAGDIVNQASLLGLGSGTARGGVPLARVAVYKICWNEKCADADILAAFDDAIADGVDIISISAGADSDEYFKDTIAIGAFHAMKKGILTSNSAGNEGPGMKSVSNNSPWSLTVGANTIDRKFVTPVQFGNGAMYEGVSVNTFAPPNDTCPIIYGGDAPSNGYSSDDSRYCIPEALDKSLVEGKVVLCDGLNNGIENLNAIGLLGIVLVPENYYNDVGFSFPLPASILNSENKADAMNYVKTTSEPTVKILKTIEQTDRQAPYVASMSSRGPNAITREILKPDLTAPGVDILAAWSEDKSVTGVEGNNLIVPYNIISGTSMSCPHASAAAAYVKSFHPDWSPAAIKSALMTTAYTMGCDKNSDAEFAYGSGQINPIKATDPGLVYDAEEIDYVKFLCGQGYSDQQLQVVTGEKGACSDETSANVWDLNYPSFALSAPSGRPLTRVFQRSVTNVGPPTSTYKAVISAPLGLKIQVEPDVLSFRSVGEKVSFKVTVECDLDELSPMKSGALVWDDGSHRVRSPVVAFLDDVESHVSVCQHSSMMTSGGFRMQQMHFLMLLYFIIFFIIM